LPHITQRQTGKFGSSVFFIDLHAAPEELVFLGYQMGAFLLSVDGGIVTDRVSVGDYKTAHREKIALW
jgi:hypothetical protein